MTDDYSSDRNTSGQVAAGGSVTGRTKTSGDLEWWDDYSSNPNTSGEVTVGGSVTGWIERPGDRDWFAVTLEAGHTYRIDLKGKNTDAGRLSDPYLRGIYDSNEKRIQDTSNDDGGGNFNSLVVFTPLTDGTYYVAAGAFGSRTGTYALSVTELADGGADDFAATSETTGEVDVDNSVTGTIESPLDRDWFAVTLEAGRTYRIDLEGSDTDAGSLPDPHLYGIYDSNENHIRGTANENRGTGLNSRVFFTPQEDDTYYIAAGAHGRQAGGYTLSVTEMTEDSDDFTADSETTGEVDVDDSVTGEIERPNDRDWFEVTLEADKIYQIDLKGIWTGSGSLFNPYLYGIYDNGSNLIAGTTNDERGPVLYSQVVFTTGEAGTYYVEAGADGPHTGDYTLSVTEVADDFAASIRTSGEVDVGGSVTGNIDIRTDHDWFAVDLVADTTYRIDLKGLSTDSGSLFDPYLRGIYDGEDNLISGTANNNGGTGRNSRLVFTATDDATYYIAASAASDSRWVTGDYTLRVKELGADDFAASIRTSGEVDVGGSVTGRIDFKGDRDWFAVTLEAGTTYRIDLEGSATGGGSLTNPYLRGIHDSDTDLISGTTDDNDGTGNNSRVEFTADDAGTYYIVAGAHGRLRGDYTLSVEELDVM